MNMVRTMVAAAACACVAHSAQAANTLAVSLEGTITSLMAVTEVKGFNCSQYNPCNPYTPSSVVYDTFGTLSAGQRFKMELLLDASTGQALTGAFATADNKGIWGGADNYGLSTSNLGGLSWSYYMKTANSSAPAWLTPRLTWQSTAAGSTLSLGDALQAGAITALSGNAQFDSCRMVQNYWGTACSGSLSLSFDKVLINGQALGAVPEPSSWALMGLGLLALAGAVRGRQTAPLTRLGMPSGR